MKPVALPPGRARLSTKPPTVLKYNVVVIRGL